MYFINSSLSWLNKMPASVHCILFMLSFVLLSQLAMIAFERSAAFRKLQTDNEVAGIIFGAISTLYSLVLAFVIIACWNDYEDLNQTIEAETDKLSGILTYSEALPVKVRQDIHDAVFTYTAGVLNKDWQADGGDDAISSSAIPSLRMLLLTAEPKNKVEERVYNVLDSDLGSLSDLRRERLSHTRSRIPSSVWFILEIGSAVLILFSFLLRTASVKLKRIYLLVLSSAIALCMYLVYSLDHPFQHNQISSQPYQVFLNSIKRTGV
ncbi:MAG: DUF4239 domain-containing protein [Sphingobacteriales bacterium]|nr:DUF4239 domain-containing protein [Sphingobacteriales bacterium]OJV98496.1 MAG: hypothetical protein BGO52_11975 [Sphingobacteriales bacterium 44-61]